MKSRRLFLINIHQKIQYKNKFVITMINKLKCFFPIKVHVALDRNPGPGYNTLLLLLIPGDILSACPNRQFHTLPGLLDSQAALSNSNPDTCVLCREAVCIIFMMVFGMTRQECEPTTYRISWTHLPLNQPNAVCNHK